VLQDRKSTLAESRSMMSSTIEPDDGSPVAPRAGADLRVARERVGWSLEQLATALRIRPQYLEALESGRVGALPGNAYALGYLRTYAATLGLDPDEVARRFKTEAAVVNSKTQLTFPVPAPERGVPAGALVLLGVLLSVGAYVGWYHLSGEGRLPAETSTQVPQRLAPLAEQATRPPPAPAPTLVAQLPTPADQAAPANQPSVQQAEAPPVPAISPSSAAAAAVPPPPAAAPPQPDQSRITLRANADAWIQVRDRAGPVLLTRILHAGDTWEVPPKPNLLLTTGNAGGTDLLVDGVTMPSLGGSGVVRRDLPLDPDLIKDGRLAAAAPRPNPQ
jgi:cytoskeleton protein RodZ